MLVKAREIINQVNNVSSGMITKIRSRDKPFYRRVWFWFGLGLGGGIILVNYGLVAIDRSLPDQMELNAVARSQTLTIKAANGTILQQQGEASREQIKLERIPDALKQAFIASEDRRFAEHNGVDVVGIIRAIASNVRSQNLVEGGSTITQQLARILFLKPERTIWRKFQEARLAQKMEQKLSKKQILERYLNLVYLGSGAYGVADAAWVYFGKSLQQLSLSEMATIAGLAPAPSIYAPDKNLSMAIMRRNLVLERMEEDGMITSAERKTASQAPLKVNSKLPKRLQVKFPYFTSYIQTELAKHVSADVLAAGGLVVETTIIPSWQRDAERAVAKTLKNQGTWGNFREGALVAINPRNGEIQVMVGGRDFSKNQFNRVTQAQRQPGSTFKSFVYATAIATGKSPYDSYLDAPLIVDGYEPKNYGEDFRGWMTMRDALTSSVNIIAVKVLMDVGFKPTIKLAHQMGIKSALKSTYSLALGANEVNLLELTSAYGSFATQGLHTEVHGIRRILNRQGQVIWAAKFKSQRVLDADSAAIMTWMLRNVVEAGTGTAAQLNDRPVAGKTGTSDQARDLWFIGYIPQMVTGVWLGNDNNKPTNSSSVSAAQTWHEFMAVVVEGMPVEKFPARPKLTGRKATIKAERIKSRRIVTRDVPTEEENSSESSPRRRRRRIRETEERSDYTPRRRRRYRSEETPRTSRRRRNDSYSSPPSPQNSSSESNQPQVSPPTDNNPSSSPTPQRSWRERLKPTESSPE